jgi:S-adenosylmethionine:tRNA ribosyltransferase-isomerase
MLHISELDYHLPAELIARHPAQPRDQSRLLVYCRSTGSVAHRAFSDLPELLNPGDLLVANDTRVLPAKLSLKKDSGGVISGLFLEELAPGRWRVMLRTRGRAAEAMRLNATTTGGSRVVLTLLERQSQKGQWIVTVDDPRPADDVLAEIGAVPLPPYIEKARAKVQSKPADDPAPERPQGTAAHAGDARDREDYQTIYAKTAGALAAPTAGLHFTEELFARLTRRHIDQAWVTLHVGLGTFLPVESETLDQHPMHHESFYISQTTMERIRRQKAESGRMVLVGTTTVRTLEAAAGKILDPAVAAADYSGSTDLLIQPGYTFKLTDALITNFHLPRSTLLALVGALVGLDRLKELYQQAIAQRYRFYSFGDAMLILP